MFTGIIQAVGRIGQRENLGVDARLSIKTGILPLADVNLGDSIAVNGVCLTAVALNEHGFVADVSGESLGLTTLGELQAGSEVNLEKALTLQTPLGGHLVSGHVDGVGSVSRYHHDGRSIRIFIRPPQDIAHYIAAKGSICVDGISLTVNSIDDNNEFGLNIVPHTVAMTTLKNLKVGQRVNLEVDVIARYLERLLHASKTAKTENVSGITESFLRSHGFS